MVIQSHTPRGDVECAGVHPPRSTGYAVRGSPAQLVWGIGIGFHGKQEQMERGYLYNQPN